MENMDNLKKLQASNQKTVTRVQNDIARTQLRREELENRLKGTQEKLDGTEKRLGLLNTELEHAVSRQAKLRMRELGVKAPASVPCPKCATQNQTTAKFCINCGSPISAPQETTTAPAAPII